METVVTIPDDVFRKAEDLAAVLGLSRSEVYAAALAEFIRERHDLRITERLNEVYKEENSEQSLQQSSPRISPSRQRLATSCRQSATAACRSIQSLMFLRS
jgi:hypothetical protein